MPQNVNAIVKAIKNKIAKDEEKMVGSKLYCRSVYEELIKNKLNPEEVEIWDQNQIEKFLAILIAKHYPAKVTIDCHHYAHLISFNRKKNFSELVDLIKEVWQKGQKQKKDC